TDPVRADATVITTAVSNAATPPHATPSLIAGATSANTTHGRNPRYVRPLIGVCRSLGPKFTAQGLRKTRMVAGYESVGAVAVRIRAVIAACPCSSANDSASRPSAFSAVALAPDARS